MYNVGACIEVCTVNNCFFYCLILANPRSSVHKADAMTTNEVLSK
jgi:hypothetical protein